MSTIPADPSMVLGQLVSREKLTNLENIGKALQPQSSARAKYDALSLAVHNLEGLYLELSNMEVEKSALEKMAAEVKKIKTELTAAAVELATKTIECQKKAADLRSGGGLIGVAAESPYDMATLEVKGAAVSTDSMNFDVQYFRKEEQTDKSGAESTADSVASFIEKTLNKGFFTNTKETKSSSASHKARTATEEQHSTHKVEGTLVLVCQCTHRIANFVKGEMDGGRAVAAWNQTFPEDYLDTDPKTLISTAMKKEKGGKKEKDKALHVLTGLTFGSSFVGLAHILEKESTVASSKSTQNGGSAETQKQIMRETLQFAIEKMKFDMKINETKGDFGLSDEQIKNSKESISKTSLTAHCSVICQGAVPEIGPSDKTQFIKQQKPSTGANFEKLQSINSQSDPEAKGSEGAQAKIGQQLMNLDGEFMKTAAMQFDQKATQIKVIDIESLLNCFKNYQEIVKGNNKGDGGLGGGVPINFYLRKLDKKDIAKAYISQYFPNGVQTKIDAQKATIGQKVGGGSN